MHLKNNLKQTTLQIHHVYFTLKQRGNGCFQVVSIWNTRGVFLGNEQTFN